MIFPDSKNNLEDYIDITGNKNIKRSYSCNHMITLHSNKKALVWQAAYAPSFSSTASSNLNQLEFLSERTIAIDWRQLPSSRLTARGLLIVR